MAPRTALPALTLPKGGGAIRGIGETFSTNPATGTGSLSIPIATSPGRGGFGVELALHYDSGAGNGPFGIGWQLATPSVTRKTDKGLPRYAGAGDSDVFVLSGAEDLVPLRVEDGTGTRLDTFDRGDYRVQRYRPRTEGLFARIERWTNRVTRDAHWRAITRDNVLSIYGRSREARIADPEHPERVFSWLLEETRDDRGNIARYIYKAEDGAGVDYSKLSEASRFQYAAGGSRTFLATAQRYLKRIQYGNRAPVMDREAHVPASDDDWLFEVVFDYGEHDDAIPTPAEARPWPVRADPFSSYRATFEVRTYRLCRRVLMFHRFAELGPSPCLVRSTDFAYDQGPVVTYLVAATQAGYIRDAAQGSYERATLPPLEFGYVRPVVHDEIRTIDRKSLAGIAGGVDGAGAQWVDLDGEGIPGVLLPTERAWFYKSNLGQGHLAPPVLLRSLPVPAQLGVQQLTDLGGDGNLDLVSYSPPLSGYFERTPDGDWAPFVPLRSLPNIDWNDPNLRFLDIDGDGLPDLFITEHNAFVWYRSRAKQGFEPAAYVTKPRDERMGPAIVFADGTETIQLADMSGDGLVDIVRVRNGEVCYWPNLGYGRFGRKVTLGQSPRFDTPDQFDPRRVRFADIDGSGTSDIFYLGRDGVRLYANQAGNSLSAPTRIGSLPPIDSHSSLSIVDLLGQGTACLVWSSPLPGNQTRPLAYIDIMGGKKPHMLESVVNNLGAEIRIAYASSTTFYLEDKAAGKPWLTRLPFPVQVIERIERYDHIARSKLVTRFAYHHGYFDGHEREFRGFACVEQWDAESFNGDKGKGLFAEIPYDVDPSDPALDLPPVRTVTWFHTGAWLERERIERALAKEYYDKDPSAPLLPDTIRPAGLSVREEREATRALRGQILRQEIYAEDGTEKSAHPYSVSERNYETRLLQKAEDHAHAVFFVHPRESIELHYERNPNDPRIQHELVLEVDNLGNVNQSAALAYPRRAPAQPEQSRLWAVLTNASFVNRPGEDDWYRIGIPVETATSELTGLVAPSRGLLSADEVRTAISSATAIPYEAIASGASLERRLIGRQRIRYYKDDLSGPLPLGQAESLALPYESYRLALTPGLVAQAFGARVNDTMLQDEGHYVQQDGMWWAPSGRVVVDAAHFYLPAEAIDPFGNRYLVRYDPYDLLVLETEDPLGNKMIAGVCDATESMIQNGNDYRVLAPALVTDPNRNRTVVEFDALGMVTKTAIMGKEGAGEGDTLDDPTIAIDYDLYRWGAEGKPARVRTRMREQHGAANTRWQESYTYLDGTGREVMRKVQAEPGSAPARGPDGVLLRTGNGALLMQETASRWVGTGRTVFDNKGNPVKQYEPFFSSTHEYEDEGDLVEWGVTPIVRYDPLGRTIRVDQPDGTFARTAFDAWSQESWDANDSVEGTPWLAARQAGTAAEQRAAMLTLQHARTPGVIHLDALGRAFLTIADNGPDGVYETRIELDIAGNPRALTDARGIQTSVQTFDVVGRAIYGISADGGARWTLLDVADKPIRSWDSRGHAMRRLHDALQRPTHLFVREVGEPESLAERAIYGEAHPEAHSRNLCGQLYQSYDGAGVVTHARFDFSGNVLESARRFTRMYQDRVDWAPLGSLSAVADIEAAAASLLEDDAFTVAATYDALNRIIVRTTPDGSETRPGYNEASLLDRVEIRIRGSNSWTECVSNIDYDARGQRERVAYGNGTTTEYAYDEQTFRLVRLRTTRSSDGRVLQDMGYTYDPVGNIVEIEDDAAQDVFFDGAVVSARGRFAYDAIYQLIEAEGREHPGQQPAHDDMVRTSVPHPNDTQALRRYVERYAYDAVGNIERMSHVAGGEQWTRHYEYASDSNRLRSTSAPGDLATGPWSHSYFHDPHGNMTRMPHLAEMRWDHADRLEYVDRQGGGAVYFAYDSGGQRVRKVYEHSGLVEERFYLGDYELYRKRHVASGLLELARETVHINDDRGRVAIIETKTHDSGVENSAPSPRIRFQLDNHLGSSLLETDDGGQVISYEEYFPFGGTAYHAARSGIEVGGKRYRYNGKERDEETGLYYYGARYYAAWLGRWTSADPAGFVDGPNLFRYCRNQPVMLVDPTGTDPGVALIPVKDDKPSVTLPDGAEEGPFTVTTTENRPEYDELGRATGFQIITERQITGFVHKGSDGVTYELFSDVTKRSKVWSDLERPPSPRPTFRVDAADSEPTARAPRTVATKTRTVSRPAKPKSSGGGWLSGALDVVQAGLDALSLALDASGVGAAVSWIPDVLNGGISAGRGDWIGAGLSMAATVPFIGAAANSARLGKNTARSLPSRSGALNQAKRDIGIPRSQHPDSVSRVPMTDRNGNRLLNDTRQPLMSREYTYTRPDGTNTTVSVCRLLRTCPMGDLARTSSRAAIAYFNTRTCALRGCGRAHLIGHVPRDAVKLTQ